MPCKHPKRDTEWYLDECRGDVLDGKCLRCGDRLSVELSNFTPSQSQLEQVCVRARKKFDKPDGNCLEISTYIVSALHEMGVPARVNKTEVNGRMHYEVIMKSTGGQKIRIDGSRDQFEQFEEVAIVEPVSTTPTLLRSP